MKQFRSSILVVVLLCLSIFEIKAQWIPSNTGLTSNYVATAFAVSGTNLFVGTSGGGVYLSTNNGTSWAAVNTGLTNTIINALAVSGTNLFAGTDGGGIFRSTNNGTNWTSVASGIVYVEALAVSGTNIFAGTVIGVFLSTNNGTNWTSVGSITSFVNALAVSGTNLFAGTSGGALLSTNNGTTWSPVNTGLTNTYVSTLAVSGTNLFAGTYGGVYRSTNNGTSWSAVTIGSTSALFSAFAFSGTNLFAGTDGGVFLSTNNGTTWSGVNTGLTNTIISALTVSGTNIIAGTKVGVFRRPLSDITAIAAPTLLSPADGALGSPAGQTLSWNASSGATSYQLHVSSNSNFSTNIIDQVGITSTSYTVSGLSNNTIYYWRVRATNAGGSSAYSSPWSFTTTFVSSTQVFCNEIKFYSDSYATVLSNASNPTNYVNGGRVVRFKLGIESQLPNGTNIQTAFGIVRSMDKKVVVTDSACGFNTVNSGSSRISTDELEISIPDSIKSKELEFLLEVKENFGLGSPWQSTFKIPVTPIRVTKAYIDDDNNPDSKGNNNQIVEPGETIEFVPEVTNFSSASFTSVKGQLTCPLSTIGIWNNKMGITEMKYDTSTIGSGALTPFQARVQSFSDFVFDCRTNSTYRIPLALTFSGTCHGIQKLPFVLKWTDTTYANSGYPVTAIEETSVKVLPEYLSLSQNFPNPFNPSTRIIFAIPTAAWVSLTILDVLGREIATLVESEKSAGVHEVLWNASNVPSGIYFYRLKTGEFFDTKRMILLK